MVILIIFWCLTFFTFTNIFLFNLCVFEKDFRERDCITLLPQLEKRLCNTVLKIVALVLLQI